MNIKLLRKLQLVVSSSIFILVFLYFLLFNNQYNIYDIQLSYWGKYSYQHSIFWNLSIDILAVSMYINIISYLKSRTKLNYKKIIYFLFLIDCFALFLTGLVDMSFKIHTYFAFFYFLLTPLLIFLLGHLNSKTISLKEWKTHIFLSVLLVLLPIIPIPFLKGLAIPELLHSSILLFWNFRINKF